MVGGMHPAAGDARCRAKSARKAADNALPFGGYQDVTIKKRTSRRPFCDVVRELRVRRTFRHFYSR
jgi:hypothetical protein